IQTAYERLLDVQADLIVVNDVGRKGVGFGVDTNEVFIVDAQRKVVHVPLTTKREVAKQLLDMIVEKIGSKCMGKSCEE
ncbi:MAG: phosphopantothenoylcysteine decarboxylase domain-containing protein, partial [Candidatus Freyarchaeota archaeon]